MKLYKIMVPENIVDRLVESTDELDREIYDKSADEDAIRRFDAAKRNVVKAAWSVSEWIRGLKREGLLNRVEIPDGKKPDALEA